MEFFVAFYAFKTLPNVVRNVVPERFKMQTLNYIDDHLQIEADQDRVILDECPMILTRKEYLLLATLVANEGEIVRRQDLLQKIWGYREDIRTRTLDVHIRRLRKKLGSFGDTYIETVFGVGYRFQRYRPAAAFRNAFVPFTLQHLGL